MQAGAARKKIVETILQLIFYAGGPAVRNALDEVKDALATAA